MAINAQDALHVQDSVLVGALMVAVPLVVMIAQAGAQTDVALVLQLVAVNAVVVLGALLLVAYLVTVVVVQAAQVIARAALVVLGVAVLVTLIVLAAVGRTANLDARNLVGLLALACV